jgi:tetratricopeptide (TPR) repeat protein
MVRCGESARCAVFGATEILACAAGIFASRAGASTQRKTSSVDQQTRHALKEDKFVSTTSHGLEWATENRQPLILWTSIIVGIILVAVLSIVIYNSRSDAASAAFGAAMQTYQTPIAQEGQPVPPGTKTFKSAAERAKAANAQFLTVADKYGMMSDGKTARYFAGLTYMESGQTQQAEETLKKVAGGWDGNLGALAKFALAELYRSTNRDQQAIDTYNDLAAHPTSTVPYGIAKLALADLYTAENKPDQAKKVYAELKDKDPKDPAGQIAAQRLAVSNPGPKVNLPQ